MKAVANLLLQQWIHARAWVLVAAVFVAATFLAKYFVPWEVDPTLIPLARCQVIYGLTLVIGMVLLPALYAEAGRSQLTRNHRLFWRAQGLSDSKYFVAVCGICFVAAAAVVLAGTVILLLVRSVDLSVASLIQSMILTYLAVIVCAPLAVGMTQWVNSSPATLLTIVFNCVGLFGPASVNAARNTAGAKGEQVFWETVFTVIPQLRLGDQSERITFCWPPIPMQGFVEACGYLIGWTLFSFCIGYVCWRKRL
jgi:hypothetical protein